MGRWSDYPKMLSRNHSKNSSGRSIGILNHIMPPRAKTPTVATDLKGKSRVGWVKLVNAIKKLSTDGTIALHLS